MSEASKKSAQAPLALAIGAAFTVGLGAAQAAQTQGDPFGMSELPGGYMLAAADGKTAEGKCGGKQEASAENKSAEGKCGESGKKEVAAEGKCGEGKCGESMGMKEPATEDKSTEGKCGEGKCGEGMNMPAPAGDQPDGGK